MGSNNSTEHYYTKVTMRERNLETLNMKPYLYTMRALEPYKTIPLYDEGEDSGTVTQNHTSIR